MLIDRNRNCSPFVSFLASCYTLHLFSSRPVSKGAAAARGGRREPTKGGAGACEGLPRHERGHPGPEGRAARGGVLVLRERAYMYACMHARAPVRIYMYLSMHAWHGRKHSPASIVSCACPSVMGADAEDRAAKA